MDQLLGPSAFPSLLTFLVGMATAWLGYRTASRKQANDDEQAFMKATADFREELRAEIARLNAQVRTLEVEVATWRGRYFQIESEAARLKVQLEELEHEMARLRPDVLPGRRVDDPPPTTPGHEPSVEITVRTQGDGS